MNLDIYTEEMAKSVWDKAFFMDKIPGATVVFDFGCADGAMIRFLAPLYPSIHFIGYDINEALIIRAKEEKHFSNVSFYTDIDMAINTAHIFAMNSNTNICLNFSSVLHEVYSTTGGLEVIYKIINHLEPRYITIRDMYNDEPLKFTDLHSERGIINIIQDSPSLYEHALEHVHEYGFISNWRELVHLLMKLQWIDNGWNEEMQEHYFSWTIDEFMTKIPGNYVISFETHYQLPYLGEKWKIEFDNWYNPDIHTHAQFILRRMD